MLKKIHRNYLFLIFLGLLITLTGFYLYEVFRHPNITLFPANYQLVKIESYEVLPYKFSEYKIRNKISTEEISNYPKSDELFSKDFVIHRWHRMSKKEYDKFSEYFIGYLKSGYEDDKKVSRKIQELQDLLLSNNDLYLSIIGYEYNFGISLDYFFILDISQNKLFVFISKPVF